jgi:hypothetical protein
MMSFFTIIGMMVTGIIIITVFLWLCFFVLLSFWSN